jgi:hypothetical protein
MFHDEREKKKQNEGKGEKIKMLTEKKMTVTSRNK